MPSTDPFDLPRKIGEVFAAIPAGYLSTCRDKQVKDRFNQVNPEYFPLSDKTNDKLTTTSDLKWLIIMSIC